MLAPIFDQQVAKEEFVILKALPKTKIGFDIVCVHPFTRATIPYIEAFRSEVYSCVRQGPRQRSAGGIH